MQDGSYLYAQQLSRLLAILVGLASPQVSGIVRHYGADVVGPQSSSSSGSGPTNEPRFARV